MKQLIYLTALALTLTLWSCGDNNDDVESPDDPNTPELPDNPDDPNKPNYPNLELSASEFSVDASGGESELRIYYNSSWTLTGTTDWCTASALYGLSDKEKIRLFRHEETMLEWYEKVAQVTNHVADFLQSTQGANSYPAGTTNEGTKEDGV